MKVEKIFFNPNEVMAIGLGLSRVIEDLSAMKNGDNINLPWTPEARKCLRHASLLPINSKNLPGINANYLHTLMETKMNF